MPHPVLSALTVALLASASPITLAFAQTAATPAGPLPAAVTPAEPTPPQPAGGAPDVEIEPEPVATVEETTASGDPEGDPGTVNRVAPVEAAGERTDPAARPGLQPGEADASSVAQNEPNAVGIETDPPEVGIEADTQDDPGLQPQEGDRSTLDQQDAPAAQDGTTAVGAAERVAPPDDDAAADTARTAADEPADMTSTAAEPGASADAEREAASAADETESAPATADAADADAQGPSSTDAARTVTSDGEPQGAANADETGSTARAGAGENDPAGEAAAGAAAVESESNAATASETPTSEGAEPGIDADGSARAAASDGEAQAAADARPDAAPDEAADGADTAAADGATPPAAEEADEPATAGRAEDVRTAPVTGAGEPVTSMRSETTADEADRNGLPRDVEFGPSGPYLARDARSSPSGASSAARATVSEAETMVHRSSALSSAALNPADGTHSASAEHVAALLPPTGIVSSGMQTIPSIDDGALDIAQAELQLDRAAHEEADAADATARDVEVTRVTLATGGLAHVEGEMAAAGRTMRLAIERPQVADVLRTLVVTGEAPVVSIDLEAAEPVGERSVVGRILAGDLADPTTILESLVGEEVVVSGGPTRLAGRLLAFARVTVPGGEDEPDRPGVRVAVATPDGRVAYATFESLASLIVEGPPVGERLEGVIPALRESVDDGRRELSVRLAANGLAGFSFVVPTTVWRPSYRAVIAEDGAVTLQGWATLENTTGLDWEDIDLRLAVGTPVAYQQDVYAPLRTSRPTAPFEVGRTAETDIVVAEEAESMFEAAPAAPQAGFAARSRSAADTALFAAPQRRRQARPVSQVVTGEEAVSGSALTVFDVPGAIDLAAGRTLTVPFLGASEEVERITYLNVARSRPPFDALEMTFDAEATVPGGLIAVYDENGFLGDARFAGADGGETRILPFALTADLNARTRSRTRRLLVGARLADGALVVSRQAVATTEISLAAAEPTELVADVAREGGARVTAEASGLSPSVRTLDPRTARVRVAVPVGAHTLTLTARRPLTESYTLTNLPTPVVEEVLALGGELDDDTRERLQSLMRITAEIAAIGRRIGRLEGEVQALRDAVAFDRDNLEAIDASTPEGAEVRQRIIERTAQIDGLLTEIRDLRREREEAEARLRAG